jgi:hypothetical protein
MAITYIALSTTTVGSGGASQVEFSSIPQTYNDLKIVVSGRTTQASTADSVYFRFNNSTANFNARVLYASGTGTGNFTDTRYAGSEPGSSATANAFSSIELYIGNYTTSSNKIYLVDAVTENNAAEAYTYLAAAQWSNSAAVTSIIVEPNAGTFVQHTTITLYGIKNS